MGYSKSERAISRMEPYLDSLVKTEKSITWQAREPIKFAQYLREAFNVAESIKHDRFRNLKKQFKIKVDQAKNLVIAEPKVNEQSELAIIIKHIAKIAIPDVNTISGIVGALISNKGYDEIHFPDAHLPNHELAQLYKWTQLQAYKIVIDVDGTTITKNEAAAEWKPQ